MEIRELVAGGADELVALFAAVLPGSPTAQADRLDEPEAFLRDPSSFVLGAYIDDTPVGSAWGLQMRSPSGRLATYLHDDRRLTVDLDGVNAVDIDVPGSLSCDHPAVLTIGFDRPAGELRVEARSDGSSSSAHLTVSEREPTWVVVQMTSDEITTEPWDELPEFG